MKKATSLLITLVLAVGAMQALPNQAKKLNSMIENTSIVSQNDSGCSGMDAIISLYKRDNLCKYYDGKQVKVYVYHEYDGIGFSHDEIEINFTHNTIRYDI